MKFASSATLLLAAALSTLSAAEHFISQVSIKPMIVKPGGLVTVTQQVVFSEDFRRKLEGDESPEFYILCSAGYDYHSNNYAESLTNKDGPKNKTDIVKPDKPDKAARPGGKLDLLADNDITLVSASIRPNNFSPKLVALTQWWVSNSDVYFLLPEDEITQLKTYTATYKFRLGDDWTSGEVVPFTVYTDNDADVVNVIVR